MINVSKIKAAREKLGLSQERIADRLNISQSTYARMESGTQKIEAEKLFQILEELQTPLGNFLDIKHELVEGNNPKYYSVPKEMYDQHVKLMGEMMAEMRKEREEFMELLKRKMK